MWMSVTAYNVYDQLNPDVLIGTRGDHYDRYCISMTRCGSRQFVNKW